MKWQTMTVFAALGVIAGTLVKTNLAVPQQGVTLRISQRCVGINDGIREMFEPTDPSVYYTNFYGTNIQISGFANIIALVGPIVEMTWDQQPGTVYIQRSRDLTNWADVRVALIGVTNYAEPIWGNGCFYRLRIGQQ